MRSTEVLSLQVVIVSTRPQHGPASLGLDLYLQLGEGGLAPFLHVGEVQEEGEDAWAAG